MAEWDTASPYLEPDFTYQSYSQPPVISPVPIIEGGVTPVTTINGQTGPSITISAAPGTGYEFNGTVLQVNNAATVRSSISAAKSGVNADITQFTGLTGNGGFNAWTGTPDQASHATYSGTASVGYVQAELQGVMDKLQQTTGLLMALLTALLANGVIET